MTPSIPDDTLALSPESPAARVTPRGDTVV